MKDVTYTVRYDLKRYENVDELINTREANNYVVVAMASTGNFLYVSYRKV